MKTKLNLCRPRFIWPARRLTLCGVLLASMALGQMPLAGRAQGKESASSTVPLAVVDGQPIYESDFPRSAETQIKKLEREIYLVRRKAVADEVSQKLLQAEAAKRGISVADLLKVEADNNVSDPTDGEVSDYYQQRQSQFKEPFDDVKDKIKQGLKTQRLNQARVAYTQTLIERAMENGNLALFLQPPNTPVSYDPARVRGSADAPVTIIEFSDFSCPFCRKAESTVAQLLSKYEGKVKLGYRDFPLTEIHPQAELAAEASRCAGEQGKYWEYHDLLFQNPAEKQDRESLFEDARTLKLDGQKFEGCLNSGKYKPLIEQDLELGTISGVAGTPGFFINGVLLTGAQPIEAFENIIDQELAASAKTPPVKKNSAAN